MSNAQPTTALEKVVEAAKAGVEGNARVFVEPDDDFAPMMLMWRDDQITISPIPDDALLDSHSKDVLAVAMTLMVRTLKPSAVALVFGAWRSDSPESGTMPRDDPNRREIIAITGVTINTANIWEAEVIRHDDAPPTLGAWRDHSEMLLAGRFVSAIQHGMSE